MTAVDLNCDLGEGARHDAELMPLISSANIACGGHAGDETTMRATVELARAHGVAIGAHPGFPDREHFGRREYPATAEEIHGWVLGQIRRLAGVAADCGAGLAQVKPHGALYNLAARDRGVADAIAAAVHAADPRLVLVGLAGSHLIDAGLACGLVTASEVFADRTYQADGSLTPRSCADAMVADESVVIGQVLRMVREGRLTARDGTEVQIRADTICLHGDGPQAVALARAIRAALDEAGIAIRARPRA